MQPVASFNLLRVEGCASTLPPPSRPNVRRAPEFELGVRVICRRLRGARSGFTFIELLVAIGIIAVLMGLLLVVIGRVRNSANATACLSNLRQITTGLRAYANDNGNRFPDPEGAGTSWESTIQSYAPNPKVFLCPSDQEVGPATGSSYDWRDTALAETTLAGRLVTDAKRADLVLTLEALPGWHAKKKMNVGLIDGSCRVMDDQEAVADLLKPIR